MSAPRTRTARTMCPMNCHPTFCGMEVDIEDNRLVNVRGDKGNPDSEGFLCVRGLATREIMDNPRRVLKPLARDVRGEDSWYEISWDEALRRIVDSMQSVGRESVAIWPGHGVLSNDYGPLANLYLALRFANMYGCQWWDTCMICWGLGGFGVGLTGAMQINTKEDMGENADLIVQWGSNHASQPNTARHIAQAKKRGARVVALDVRMSDACRSAHDRFIVKPGTDAALALAMMHVIIAEDLYDAEFVALHTLGFDELRAHVAPLTPQWAAEICGVEANRIADFARDYARTKRAMILIGGASMHKDANGWEAARAISCHLVPARPDRQTRQTRHRIRAAPRRPAARLWFQRNYEFRRPATGQLRPDADVRDYRRVRSRRCSHPVAVRVRFRHVVCRRRANRAGDGADGSRGKPRSVHE